MPINFRTRSKSIQPDPSDVGACCKLNTDNTEFVCEDNVKFIDCKRELGLFRGKNSSCLNNSCPTVDDSGFNDGLDNFNSDQHGACVRCSSCIENVTEEFCIDAENFDAEFFGGKTCKQADSSITPNSVKHACCIDDGCFDTCNKSYCLDLGGIYHDGISTELAVRCSSNPCGFERLPNTQELGSCCKAQKCLGVLTQVDCVNNGGSWKGEGTDCNTNGNYDCINDRLIGDRQPPIPREPSGLEGASVVCSKPTTMKYYGTTGAWNGVTLPEYTDVELEARRNALNSLDMLDLRIKARESVWVELMSDEGQCTGEGGVVSSTDGDVSKATMWGGCQWYDNDDPDRSRWRCDATTYDGCADKKGVWHAGLYCDEIENWPVNGKLLAKNLPSGVGIKFLAGRCNVIDNLNNISSFVPGESINNVECHDMLTEFQCYETMARRKDRYEAAGNVLPADPSDYIRSEWEGGKKCTDCIEGGLETQDTLGLCILDTVAQGSYYSNTSAGDLISYRAGTGKQRSCLSGFTVKDCELQFGQWINTCETCEEHDSTYPEPVSTGSCCTSATNCVDNKSFGECEALNGFFHGAGTVCTDTNGNSRDCGKVAYLTKDFSDVPVNLDPAVCQCKESDNPNAADPDVVSIFARRDRQNQDDIWAGSQCGDPTVSAFPLSSQQVGYQADVMGLYSLDGGPTDSEPTSGKFTDSREISLRKYNWEFEPFRDFIKGVSGASGSFLDNILIEFGSPLFFRVDKQEPFMIPKSRETLKEIRGSVLQTNQPASDITSISLNDPQFGWQVAPPPLDRKITYVNLEGMTNLREFAVQGNNWTTLQEDFEAVSLPLLRILDLRSSNLQGLNLDNALAIESLNLSNNNITGNYDLSSARYLTTLDVSYNNISEIDFGNEDKIYLTNINLSYNNNLSSIRGTFPQIVSFSAIRCNISEIDLTKKPFLTDIELLGNSLSYVKISKTPSIRYIGLDNTIGSDTQLSECILPTLVNRKMLASDLPTSIEEAVIPDVLYMNKLNFRKNTIDNLGYDDFVSNLAETVAITFVSKFTETNFTTVGNLKTRSGSIYCKEIDFSHVTESTTENSSSVVEFLKCLFGNANPGQLIGISGEEKIRIILTGINTSVRWENSDPDSLRTALQNAIPTNVYNKLALII